MPEQISYHIISYQVKSDQIVPYHTTSYHIISNQTVPKANHTISHQNQPRPNQTIPNHSIMYHGQCIVQKVFKALGPYCHPSHNGNHYDGLKKQLMGCQIHPAKTDIQSNFWSWFKYQYIKYETFKPSRELVNPTYPSNKTGDMQPT